MVADGRGEGVKNLPNLRTDSSKKTADGRGVGVKNRENLRFVNAIYLFFLECRVR